LPRGLELTDAAWHLAHHAAVVEARRGAPMLGVLQQLRSISLHPAAGDDASDGPFIEQSARLVLAFRLLDDLRSREEKALVFLDSRAVQGPLMELLQRRYRLRDRVLIINGEVSGKHRKARVDAFQERRGFDVMILSPKAGGVGMNRMRTKSPANARDSPRLGGHMRSYESAVGVCHREAKASSVHEGLRGGRRRVYRKSGKSIGLIESTQRSSRMIVPRLS